MTIIKYIFMFTVVAILLFCVAISIPLSFSDSGPVKEFLLHKVGDAIGGDVDAEHLEISLFSSPQIELKKLMIQDREEGRILLQLHDGYCDLQLLPLVFGQVVINQCTLDQPVITMRRQQNGLWSWLIFPDSEQDSGTSLVTFAGLKDLGIHNGRVTMIDESISQYPRTIVLSHLKAMMTMKSESNQINFQATAEHLDTESPSTLSIVGRIQTKPSADHTETFSFQQATVKIDVSNIELRPFLEFIEPEIVLTAKNPVGNLQSTLSLFPDQAGYTLIFSDLSTRIDTLTIHGKASVTGLLSHEPAFLFMGSVPTFQLATLMQLIPSTWWPIDVQKFLTTYNFGGNIAVENISISGPLMNDTDVLVVGTFNVSQGWMNLDSSYSTLQNIHGSVILNQDHLTLNEVSLEYASSKIESAYGRIEFREPHPSLTLTAKANILAEDALRTAHQYYVGKQDLPAWLDLQDVEGDASVTLMVEGPLTEPGELKIHQGELVVRNLGFRPTTYPLSIQALSGHIRFDQNHLTMDGFSAEYEASKILQASGRIEFREPQPMLTLTASASILAEDALRTLRQFHVENQILPKWLDLQEVEGDASVTVMIAGPLTEPSELKIHQGELRVRNLGFQTTTYPFSFRSISGDIGFDQEHAVIRALRGKVGNSWTTLLGRVPYESNEELLDVTLRSEVELSDLQQTFPNLTEESGLSGGPMDMAMSVSGSAKQPTIHMKMDLTPLNVSYPSVFQKPSGIPTWLKFDGALMQNQILKVEKSSLEIPPFHLDMKGELSVDDSKMINLTLTTGSDKSSYVPMDVIVGPEPFAIRQVEANLSIMGPAQNWLDWQTSGIIALNQQKKDAKQPSTGTHQTARIQWTQENHVSTVHLRSQNLPLEAIIPRENSKAPQISGILSMNISLETALTPSRSLIESMTGQGEFQIQNGHIVQSPVISRILGLLNLPNLLMGKVNLIKEGVPFHNLTGTVSVRDGLLTSKNLLLNSPILKMTAAGTYDMPDNRLDFILAVSPFGEYSNLLKSIPMFGRLLKGERKGLTTALFEVKGPREEPEVRYLPLESFAGGLQGLAQFAVDILKNTITLPTDLMTEPQEERTALP